MRMNIYRGEGDRGKHGVIRSSPFDLCNDLLNDVWDDIEIFQFS